MKAKKLHSDFIKLLPVRKSFNPGGIPEELKQYQQWVTWAHVQQDEPEDGEKVKGSKLPVYFKDNILSKASIKYSTSYDKVLKVMLDNPDFIHGLGFVFKETDPFTFIDFDKMTLDDDRFKWVTNKETFVEHSQSGTGLHMIVKAVVPGKGAHKPVTKEVEIYNQNRFCALTGVLAGQKRTVIMENQQIVDDLIAAYPHSTEGNDFKQSGEKWLNKFRVNLNPKKPECFDRLNKDIYFRKLWERKAGLGRNSEDDHALCCYLLELNIPVQDIGDLMIVYRQKRNICNAEHTWSDWIPRTITNCANAMSIEIDDNVVVVNMDGALGIKSQIQRMFSQLDGFDKGKLQINVKRIHHMLSSTFWQPDKSKIYSLANGDVLNAYSKKEAFQFMVQEHGQILNQEYLSKVIEVHCKNLTEKEATPLRKSMLYYPGKAILDYILFYNQQTRLNIRTDIFATRSTMDLNPKGASIVYKHIPFPESHYEQKVVNDFKEHFPQFDKFLQFIIASRFAADRKQSFLWLYCDSDWGKGMLMNALKQLDAAVEFSVKEVEAIFEKKPVAKTKESFRSAFVCVFDEFKTVKSELKELQSTITLSPKNQLECKVEVYTKLFFSAENVASLVGSEGVEDQFANRMSMIRGEGSILKRPLRKEVSGEVYFESIKNYMAKVFNENVSLWQEKGRSLAALHAEIFLQDFIDTYGLGVHHTRLSEGVVSIAAQFVDDIIRYHKQSDEDMSFNEMRYFADCIVSGPGDELFLRRAGTVFKKWLEHNYDSSELYLYLRNKDKIFAKASVNGDGLKNRKVQKDTQMKSIRIR